MPDFGILKKHYLAIGAVLPVIYVYLVLTWKHSYFYGMTGDSAVYLLMADAFSPFSAMTPGMLKFLLSNYPFPPMYPVVLGFLGGGTATPHVSHLSSLIFLFATLISFYIWSNQSGLSRNESVLTTLIFSVLPVTLKHLMLVESEHLYMFLTLTGFVIVQYRKSNQGALLLSGLLFGMSAVTRSIGIAAVAVYCFTIWRERGFRRSFGPMMLSVSIPVIWMLYKWLYLEGKSYFDILQEGFAGSVTMNLIPQVSVNLQLLWLYWVNCFDPFLSGYTGVVLLPVTVLVIAGLILRTARMGMDSLYVIAYLVIVAVWPYPAQIERFLFAIMPFLLFYGVYLTRLMGTRMLSASPIIKQSVIYGYGVVLAIIIMPTLGSMWENYHHSLSETMGDAVRTPQWLFSRNVGKTHDSLNFMHLVYLSMQDINEIVSDGDCVISTVPEYVMLFSGRKSLKPDPSGSDDLTFMKGMQQCKYVFMVAAVPKPDVGNPPMYPFQRIKDSIEVLSLRYIDEDSDSKLVRSMLARYKRYK